MTVVLETGWAFAAFTVAVLFAGGIVTVIGLMLFAEIGLRRRAARRRACRRGYVEIRPGVYAREGERSSR